VKIKRQHGIRRTYSTKTSSGGQYDQGITISFCPYGGLAYDHSPSLHLFIVTNYENI
jgi:hypothetical protein